MPQHKHAELIKAWADGAIIEFAHDPNGPWCDISEPIWHNDTFYRIKPKEKVKKWRWVLQNKNDPYQLSITAIYFASPDEYILKHPGTSFNIIQRIDSAWIEEEV